MKLTSILLALLTCCSGAYAKDCEFTPKKSFCNISLTSPQEVFINQLGAPSTTLNLKNDAIAIVYSNEKASRVTTLIFSNKLLKEIRSWETNNNIDFWWYSNDKEVINVVVGGINFIGKTRAEVESLSAKFVQIDADGHGYNLEYFGSEIDITFLPFYGPSTYNNNDFNDYTKYQGNYFTIRNINGKL